MANAQPRSPIDIAANAPMPRTLEGVLGEFDSIMKKLQIAISEESRLLKDGKLLEAAELSPEKTALAMQYLQYHEWLMQKRDDLQKFAPDRLHQLRIRHELFKAELQVNLAVLSTAREVSDSIIRKVSQSVHGPSTHTYGGTGHVQTSAPIREGLAIDKNL
ncbi:MAG: hypothetical protein JKY49_03770 [Cohaesibacteraceae bacterium]|nr:hypothetical protein [Cohaesibacteraceae bacterium]MBL4874934.1 hypothetical protein [Cohaesibacteraceae bacterium]MBL4875562.1 hypothetical protein [Cohaesibacteraceae bacterium]